jgi:hypothetical protein
LDLAIQGICTALTFTSDPAEAAKEFKKVCLLLTEANEIADNKCPVESTLQVYNFAHGFTPAGDGPGMWGQVQQQGHALGVEFACGNLPMAALPIVGQSTYSSPAKNLQAVEYIAFELGGLEGNELHEKQECLQATKLQQETMEPAREATSFLFFILNHKKQ